METQCCVRDCRRTLEDGVELIPLPIGLDLAKKRAWLQLTQADISQLKFGFENLVVCPLHFNVNDLEEKTEQGVSFKRIKTLPSLNLPPENKYCRTAATEDHITSKEVKTAVALNKTTGRKSLIKMVKESPKHLDASFMDAIPCSNSQGSTVFFRPVSHQSVKNAAATVRKRYGLPFGAKLEAAKPKVHKLDAPFVPMSRLYEEIGLDGKRPIQEEHFTAKIDSEIDAMIEDTRLAESDASVTQLFGSGVTGNEEAIEFPEQIPAEAGQVAEQGLLPNAPVSIVQEDGVVKISSLTKPRTFQPPVLLKFNEKQEEKTDESLFNYTTQVMVNQTQENHPNLASVSGKNTQNNPSCCHKESTV